MQGVSQLQWGRRVSAAERSLSGPLSCGLSRLQWGRRVSAAESGPSATYSTVRRPASMGPPRFSGGKLTDRLAELQERIALQWGRRVSAAESWRSRRRAGRRRSFNGAAAFQRRKGPMAGTWKSGRKPASMGPPRFSGGKLWGGGVGTSAGPASMGPPRFSGGKQNGRTAMASD